MGTWKKLSDITEFTVKKVWGYKWKMWDNETQKTLSSDTWKEGYSKKYSITTEADENFELSASQFGNMLEGVNKDGVSDLNGKTFRVKTNGKSGKDIRYYINPVATSKSTINPSDDDLPF